MKTVACLLLFEEGVGKKGKPARNQLLQSGAVNTAGSVQMPAASSAYSATLAMTFNLFRPCFFLCKTRIFCLSLKVFLRIKVDGGLKK